MQLRTELAVMEATLDFARTESEEKDETIERLRALLAQNELSDTEDKALEKKKSL